MNRQQRRHGGKSQSPFRPAARSRAGRTNYDNLAPELRRDYVLGVEEASEKIAGELNATRLALAVMLDRHGGEAMIGDADVARVSGRRIVSDKAEIGADAWVFRLVEARDDA